ncbi:hypothetical protein CHLNCDRAFT_37093 [Chlorella variabilis]|uniref:Amino acid transporter transmembrane domain-containing protein n=1 Tax=Chlorella variabilis TaxID=554065 RepID=E1ZQA7_CHLVA|nr:hypothetical protein CHLNCDRAFT_37093 [Chlorella variabilis]EFN51991.1 hypothetical protein CHLNCDRAFT_37093 [Chlorella variabilis]|eukprot:XP_005844093.1 hypothetical protein CHLNCDRAFT_37093 [Chlorella variabilis]
MGLAAAGGASSRRRWGGGVSESEASKAECGSSSGLDLADSGLSLADGPPTDAQGLEEPRRTGTTFTALMHVLTAVIGAGVLALPYAVAMLGWVAGPLCIICFGALTQVCSVLLADCYIINGKINRTYSECVAATFRPWAVTTIGIIQHVNLVLVTWAYAITAPQSLQTIARSICSEAGWSSCFTNYNWWAIIFGGSQLLMVQMPDIDHLKYSSIIGGLMSFGYSGIAVGLSAAEGAQPCSGIDRTHMRALPRWPAFHSWAPPSLQVLNAIGAILFAFNFSIQLVEIQERRAGRPGPVASMRRAILVAVCIMTSIYIAVACSGYAAFGDEVAGSIMMAFTTPMWLVTAGNLMVVIHVGPAYQICLQPTLLFLEDKMVRWRRNPGWNKVLPPAQPPAPPSHPFPALPQGLLMRLWFRSMFVVLITFLACLMPWFGTIIGLSGALSFWPATVAFPVEMWLRVRQPSPGKRRWLRWLSLATLVITFGVRGGVRGAGGGWAVHIRPVIGGLGRLSAGTAAACFF